MKGVLMPPGSSPEYPAKAADAGRKTPTDPSPQDTAKRPSAPPTKPEAIIPDAPPSDADAIAHRPTLEASAPDSPTKPSSSGSRSLVGTRMGDFELLAELGRGGMGVVYKAQQLSLERSVAVKMLLAEHEKNPIVLTRFLTEARTDAALDHPNIIKVFQVGETALGHYFVMEFVDGPSLERVIQRGPLPLPAAMSLAILLAGAVHYAHTKGVIHRDLKPANIILDRSRRPVIMDFGIAKCVGRSAALTQQGAIMGTPGYMPPEQAGEDPSKVGPYSDVYSLGAILYSMLSGRPPYDEDTALKTLLKVVSEELPPPVRDLRQDVPPRLEQICMKCLHKKPAERYASARELAEALRQFRAGLGKSAAAPRRPKSPAILMNLKTQKHSRLFLGTNVIGRAPGCDVVILAREVSKRHCQITVGDDGAEVEDLSSINGTSVNGQPVTRCRLTDGDEVAVAGHRFQFRFRKGE
jgi:serine/threonine protein kinase